MCSWHEAYPRSNSVLRFRTYQCSEKKGSKGSQIWNPLWTKGIPGKLERGFPIRCATEPEEFRMSLVPLQLVDDLPSQPCGGCTACCAVLKVTELGKGFHTPCPNISSSGCRIYPDRPKSCRDWSCLWAGGVLPAHAHHRPDRLGLILDLTVVLGLAFITAYEVRPGASREPEARDLLDRIRQRYKLCIISAKGTITSTDATLAEELRLSHTPKTAQRDQVEEEAVLTARRPL